MSEQGVNGSCFAPAGIEIGLTSDLPQWDCVRVSTTGELEEQSLTQTSLRVSTKANELVSCIGQTG